MRLKFEQQIAKLNNSLIEMGGLIEYAISMAIKALIEQDVELAKKAIEFDQEIDAKEKEIENICLKLLLEQQPVARDLRLISSALKMITDMERIGDHSADISEITIAMASRPFEIELVDIPKMAKETTAMVNDAIDAFVKKDLLLAETVLEHDDVVDSLFVLVRDDLIRMLKEEPESGELALDLMMVAKYFERIGDHATNIAEWVVFSIVGDHNIQT